MGTNKKKAIKVSWEGSHISLNDWYGSNHWTIRQTQKNRWHDFFKGLLTNEPVLNFETYTITLVYNSRLDPSNTVAMVKLFEDTMKKLGMITDDSKKYCKGISIIPDETLNKKEYTIIVTGYES